MNTGNALLIVMGIMAVWVAFRLIKYQVKKTRR